MYRMKISAILERDNITPKESHQFRVGRTGEILLLEIGRSMTFAYDSERCLHTSTVIGIERDSNGITIITRNSIYILDRIEEE